MNIKDISLDSLTDVELDALSAIVYDEKERRVRNLWEQGKLAHLNAAEHILRKTKPIDAINSYRARTGASLRDAHFVFKFST